MFQRNHCHRPFYPIFLKISRSVARASRMLNLLARAGGKKSEFVRQTRIKISGDILAADFKPLLFSDCNKPSVFRRTAMWQRKNTEEMNAVRKSIFGQPFNDHILYLRYLGRDAAKVSDIVLPPSKKNHEQPAILYFRPPLRTENRGGQNLRNKKPLPVPSATTMAVTPKYSARHLAPIVIGSSLSQSD